MANTNEFESPLVNFPRNIWGDRFLSLPFNNSELESYSKQVEALKEVVKDMLMASPCDPLDKIRLINSLCRLGLSYHFENEIEEQLGHLFVSLTKSLDDNDHDLYTTAVVFQVFRSHMGVFSKFQDADGKFKEALIGNIMGMISLYEASHFRMSGELILDEALTFTTKHLEYYSLAHQPNSHLREYIENALNRPYRRGMPRIEARQYISFYEKDESRNVVLLKFSKCDFNWVQLLFQQELSVLSSWYKEVNMESMFPYIRHRYVEGFLYTAGLYFEPCYARARDIVAKHIVLVGIIDDTYEAFALYQELGYLTDAIKRFDISAMDDLPADYQKNVYETILNVHDEAENQVRKEGRSYSVSYTKDEFKKFVIAHQVEARWSHEGYLPTFDEYLENGAYISGAILGMCQVLIGMEEADKNANEWLINKDNKIHKALQMATRLYNDIVTNEVEEKRRLVSATVCYMKQYNVSRKEAIEAFLERIEVAWKDLNEGCMRPTPVPQQIIRRAVNYFGLLDVAYKHRDEYTTQTSWKHYITKMFIDPIPIEE